MKKELFLAIVTAIVGIAVGFTVVNVFAGSIDPFTIMTLYPSGSSPAGEEDYSALGNPNPEIFNYKSINPTVEVYVGNGSSTIIVPENEQPENPENPENPDNSPDTPEEEQ